MKSSCVRRLFVFRIGGCSPLELSVAVTSREDDLPTLDQDEDRTRDVQTVHVGGEPVIEETRGLLRWCLPGEIRGEGTYPIGLHGLRRARRTSQHHQRDRDAAQQARVVGLVKCLPDDASHCVSIDPDLLARAHLRDPALTTGGLRWDLVLRPEEMGAGRQA